MAPPSRPAGARADRVRARPSPARSRLSSILGGIFSAGRGLLAPWRNPSRPATADPMQDGRLRIGIAGAGHFGRFHALKVAGNPRAVLAGLFDPDRARAEAVGQEAGGAPALDWPA